MSKLGNYISVQNGYAFKSKDFIKNLSGMPVIKISNVTGGSFIDLSSYDTISEEIARKVKSFQTKDDDILVAMTGANVGKVSRIAKGTQPCLINQRVGRFILKEDCPYSSDFIYYLVSSNKSFQYFSNTADGAAQPNISGKLIEDLEFPDISPKAANKAGKYLKVLDEKIQLNTQINQTLEQITQALFKSWFVDFDPVRAKVQALSDGLNLEQAELAAMQAISGKTPEELTALSQTQPDRYAELAEIAKAFPCEMVEVDGVEVPKEWEYCTFGDVSECFDSKRIPLSKQQREKRKGNIPYYGATSVMDYVDEAIFDDIYLLIGEDGSVLKEDGTPFTQYIWGKSWVNNHAHVIKGKNGVSTEHLMLFIQQTNITAYITGAVQLKLNQKNMNSIPFIKASNKTNLIFAQYIEPLYAKIRKNFDENKILETTRDLLLPRLLNGEI